MCHLVLLLPIIALPVFWLWSWPVAVSVYVVVLIVSGWTYVYAMVAMHRPVVSGVEHTLHSQGVVVDATPNGLRVRVNSEYWPAECKQAVRAGDVVRVIGREGLTLLVEPVTSPAQARGDRRGGGGQSGPVLHP